MQISCHLVCSPARGRRLSDIGSWFRWDQSLMQQDSSYVEASICYLIIHSFFSTLKSMTSILWWPSLLPHTNHFVNLWCLGSKTTWRLSYQSLSTSKTGSRCFVSHPRELHCFFSTTCLCVTLALITWHTHS